METTARWPTLMGLLPSPISPVMQPRACCCSCSFPNLTKPYPLLNPDSSSTTWQYRGGELLSAVCCYAVMRYLSTPHRPVSLGEVSVQSEVVHLGGEITDPDRRINLRRKICFINFIILFSPVFFYLSGSQASRIVVQLESNGWVGVGNDLKGEMEFIETIDNKISVSPFHPFYAWQWWQSGPNQNLWSRIQRAPRWTCWSSPWCWPPHSPPSCWQRSEHQVIIISDCWRLLCSAGDISLNEPKQVTWPGGNLAWPCARSAHFRYKAAVHTAMSINNAMVLVYWSWSWE